MLPGLKKRVINLHDVLMYVAIARKHLRLMLLLVCFSWLAGLVFYVYARPVYFSRSLIKIDFIDQQLNAEKEFNEPARFSAIMAQLTAPHIVEHTAAKLGVISEYRELMRTHLKKIVTRKNSESHIEIEIYPYNLDWSKRWCETMVKEFLDYKEQRRAEELEQRRENIARDIEEMERLVNLNKSNVTEIRAQFQTDQAKMAFDQIADLPVELPRIRKQLDELGRIRLQIISPDLTTIEKLSRISAFTEKLPVGAATQTNISAPPSLRDEDKNKEKDADSTSSNSHSDSINVQIMTPGIAQARSAWRDVADKLHKLENQRDQLSANFLPGHPKMLAIQKDMDQVNAQLDSELRNATTGIEMEFSYLLDRVKTLESKFPDYLAAQNNLKTAQEKEQFARRSQTDWTRYIARRKQQLERSDYAYDREKVNLSYAGLIEFKDLPISPNRFSLLIYTTMLGCFLAIGIPFLIEYLDHTLTNLEEVESTFQLRGLGIIPKMDGTEASAALIDREHAKEHNLLENFRVIRTNLLSMGALSKPPHVLMITSAMPKEGKTVVSTNLALSFAQTGSKTVLIDTDLRRGRLHRLFGYRKQPGLSGVLLGQHSLEEAIRPTPHENLSIISAGQHVDTGTELLGSQKFADIMIELRKRYDRIVVDTPPVLGLSETSVLQNQVDGVLFVIWSGHTEIKAVKASIEMLQSNGANFYGFVLNRLDLSATANYYQYYYYSHDYYYQYQPATHLENS
ncbi:MAG: polysaccharide biosynthesis tyrosine autokinase [Verrucomicrobiota bacterium]